jgi:hypothetical protein
MNIREGVDVRTTWISTLVIASIPLFMFVCNLLLGPTCTCHFHTAVQQERIQAVNRLRTARKIMAKLLPLIEAAQGPLQPEQLDALGASEKSLRLAQQTSRPEKPFRHSLAKYHAAFYVLLLLDSASCFMEMFVTSSVRDFFSAIITVLLFGVGTMDVVDQRRTFIHLGLQRFTLFSFILQFVLMVVAISASATYGVIMASRGHGLDVVEGFRNSDAFLWLVVINGTISLLLAIVGLMRLNTYFTALKNAKTEAQAPNGA